MDPKAKPIGMAERFMTLIPGARDAVPKGAFRAWPVIEVWADEIATALQLPASPG